MTEVTLRVVVVAFLAAGLVAVAVIVRKMLGAHGLSTLFAPKAGKRLDVVEQTMIDPKRRLILIRRDGVEHLIMTGGPVDLVIESGIGSAKTADRTTQPTAGQRTLQPVGTAAE